MKKEAAGVDKRTLLIIDDDVEWTELLTVFFSKKYQVSVAHNADAAIEAIRAELPHAIILDLVMPSVDGFGFMHRIGELSLGEVPTILITGWDSPAIEECAAAVGCAAVLSKPVSLPELEQVVSALMEAKPANAPAASESPHENS